MPYNILLVDDDADFREEFSAAFGNYAIVQADSGEAALGILEKPNEIDLIIMDVMMPGLKGTEALARIKEKNPELSIIILTGHSSKDIAVEALKAKADDYIEKPVDIPETQEIISRLLLEKRVKNHGDPCDPDGKIARTLEFIRRNCDKKITLEDVSALVNLSPKYFSRIFEKNTGKTFMEFKAAEKIKYSEKLLREGFNINQTADGTGYENVESFIRAFKKVKHMTPSSFKKSLEKKHGGKSVRKNRKKKGNRR
jgi:YesN/AraC family two-component response regulator